MPEVDRAVRIARIAAFACRAPIRTPVATSFGVMRNRPAVFVRVEDADGAFGWGEAFANWPAAGAEHRVNLLIDDVGDLVLGRSFADPPAMFDALSRETRIRALQCGEPGPFRQIIAALDIAAWDMVARRGGVPLARALSPDAAGSVPAYASGIHVDAAATEIPRARAEGFGAFKVKVGFRPAQEPGALRAIAERLEPGDRLFADANQAWDADTAVAFIEAAGPVGLGWLEEPIAADAPAADWRRVARCGLPLAGGENVAGRGDFEAAIAGASLSFVQPDVAKWGGVTGALWVARRAAEAGQTYCPHFLGGGIGLVASAHVLAAAGGPGLLEVDINPNPLRSAFDLPAVRDGRWAIADAPGLGIAMLPEDVAGTLTLERSASA